MCIVNMPLDEVLNNVNELCQQGTPPAQTNNIGVGIFSINHRMLLVT